MRLIPRMTGLQWLGAVLVLGSVIGAGVLIGTSLPRPDSVPSVPLDQLGLDVDHATKAQVIAGQMPAFRIVGADGEDNSRKNVRLWDAMLQLRGEHQPNVPQQIGDCVSWGAANAVNYLQAVQLVRGPPGEEFHPAYPPWIYGASRVWVGRSHGSNFRGDGSVGAYAAEALNKHGCLRADHERVPSYSGAVAREWGAKGPPEWAREIARPNVVQTVAQVSTAAEARDAICNGFPVTIASGWWGTTDIPVVDGRRVARRTTAWAHQQCLIGYDGSGREPLFYCLNSWGPNAHPAPLQGEPPGGYWIRFKDVDRICQEGDSWAFSGFEGFPAAGPNWDELLNRSVAVPVGQSPNVSGPGRESIMDWGLLGVCLVVGLAGVLLFRMARQMRVALAVAVCVGGSGVYAQDFDAAASRSVDPVSTVATVGPVRTLGQPSAPGISVEWGQAETRPVTRTTATGPERTDIWQAACERVEVGATGQRKPQALVFIRSRGCSACDQVVGYLQKHATPKGWQVGKAEDADFRIVDVLDNRQLARLYGVEVVPTTLYLSRAGTPVERREGWDAEVSWVASLVAQY